MEILPGDTVDEVWARPVSELSEPLDVPCRDRAGGSGPYDVVVDDVTGFTWLVEGDHVWVRTPAGVVPDLCWWLPSGPGPRNLPVQGCILETGQDGTCTGDEDVPAGWIHTAGGVVDGGLDQPVAVPGALIGWRDGELQRLDTSASSHIPIDATEGPYTWHRWLPPLSSPEEITGAQLALAEDTLVAWTDGHLWTGPAAQAVRNLGVLRSRPAPHGDAGVLAAVADVALVATPERVDLFTALRGDHQGSEHLPSPSIDPVLDAVVSPQADAAWVLTADEVVLLQDGAAWEIPTPGAEGLLLGRPGGEPVAYAWGTDGDDGVVYRLEGTTAVAWHLPGEPVLGAGIGRAFQELVLVLDPGDGPPEVRGFLDEHHLDAIPDGTVGLAIAAFVESPRDSSWPDTATAAQEALLAGTCLNHLHDDDLLCCVHDARGASLARQLAWLARRQSDDWPGGPAAVVLGVNPTAIGASTWCDTHGHDGSRLPEAILDHLDATGDATSLAVFIHSQPYTEASAWVRCPDRGLDGVDASCWDEEPDAENFASFYDALMSHTSLAPWGEEPDWTLLGGGYEGANVPETSDWTGVFPDLALPDGARAEDGLYFGLAGMNPRVDGIAAKELAPLDARLRPFPVEVGHPAASWDDGSGDAGGTFRPGQTVALPWLYEYQRSGLRFMDWLQYANQQSTPPSARVDGDESPRVMTRADFVVQEHLLVARVLASTDTTTPRWWTFHLHDLSSLRELPLDDGWVDCRTDCETDTELDRFLLRIEDLGPAVTWSARPPQ